MQNLLEPIILKKLVSYMKDGFIKVAAASPVIKVADAGYNADRISECVKTADEKGVKILVFPELSLTGRCCDLIGHKVILEGCSKALEKVAAATEGTDMLIFVGLPVAVGARLYSCAAALYNGEILGLIPKEEVGGTPFAVPPVDEAEVNLAGQLSFLCADTLFEFAPFRGCSSLRSWARIWTLCSRPRYATRRPGRR